ncbi:hypothetical protein [Rubrivirga sp. IMCC45206]|uniref:hypothetical protein n=1 Tax=Rubrivirga sp. IMCC45206 TaxID=3391614 RepID=UPI00398FA1D3
MPKTTGGTLPLGARLDWRVGVAAVITGLGLATLLVPLASLPPLDTQAWIGLEVEVVAHLALSAGAVVLWAWARPRLPLAMLTALALGVAVGTEVVQMLPSVVRTPEVADAGYNVVGIAIGLVVIALARGVRSGRRGGLARQPG